jgi:hypothetical protein
VGVIGGTFLQVWDDFTKTKKTEAEMLRREMVYVSRAIQRIEPAKVSRLVLLEVWNDDGTCELLPNSPEDFMGEVRVELELPQFAAIKGRELRLRLEPNPHVVKREVAGQIFIRYDWDPASCITNDGLGDVEHDSAPTQKLLHGMLRLQVLGASGLINVDWGRHGGTSSPYVMVVCYPTSPAFEDQLQPSVWRTPTAPHTMFPSWGDCFHSFAYLWCVPEHTAEHRALMSDTIGDDNPSPTGRSGADTPSNAQVVHMLSQLTSSLPKLTSSLAQIQEEVQHLSGRVDRLASSLRDRDRIGVDGSERLILESQATMRGGAYQSTATSGVLRETTMGSIREPAHGIRATASGLRSTASGTSPSSPCNPQCSLNNDTVGALRTTGNIEQNMAVSLKEIGSVVLNGGTASLPNAVTHELNG